MPDSVWPHRRQPTRLPCLWDSPGKNTGVGCHFLLQCMKVKSESEAAQSCPTPSNPMDCSPPGSSVHGILQARVLEWVAIVFSNKPLGTAKKRKQNKKNFFFYLRSTKFPYFPNFRWKKIISKQSIIHWTLTEPLTHRHTSQLWDLSISLTGLYLQFLRCYLTSSSE